MDTNEIIETTREAMGVFVLSMMPSTTRRFTGVFLEAPFSMQWLNSRSSLMRPKTGRVGLLPVDLL